MYPTQNKKKTIRTILFLFIFAMLAHLCTAQLLRGAEKFTRDERFTTGVMGELRGEATVVGAEVRLRQIVRWSDADKDVFEPIGDLVVARFGSKQGFQSIGVGDLRNLLRDAGVNVAMMNFTGTAVCTITRSDASVPQQQKLEQLVRAQETPSAAPSAAASSATSSVAQFVDKEPEKGVKSLRDLLVEDVASRLGLPIESLQVTFRGTDEKTLRLSEPQVQFGIDPQRQGNLGEVSWNVTMATGGTNSRVFIIANARAWQDQVVVARPLSTKQLITDTDAVDRRVLVDRISDDPLLKREQVVGQMASRDLKPGTPFSARLVDAVQLVRPGQFVTIEHAQGAVKIKIVAKALDGGCYGQSIRVKNEATREILRVTITGPQEGSLNGVADGRAQVAGK